MVLLMLCQGEMEKLVIATMMASALSLYHVETANTAERLKSSIHIEVDYVVPLSTRRGVQPEQPEPDCNWMESYNYNMKVAQAEDKEAQLLIRWLDEEKPAHSELRLMDPAMQCYYS